MREALAGAILIASAAGSLHAQIIPRLPGGRGAQPAPRDTIKDTTRIRFATPDSVGQRLLQMPGFTVTRYQGDTAVFNAQNHALDLLAGPPIKQLGDTSKKPGKRRLAAVDRDQQIIQSDSGIYYTESNHRVVSGGAYIVVPPPKSNQADIVGHGRLDYNLTQRTARITNARLPVNNGEMWYMDIALAEVMQDTSGKGVTVWGKGAIATSCPDSIPDYHFELGETKRTSDNTIAGRPAVLYIKDVPVLWLPFFFSDTKGGRHSGIITPQFGLGDIVRNSSTYRRHVDHAGYYWAASDYMDFATWLDWRSSAGSTQGDPGWLRLNTDMNYRWLDRFLNGRVGVAYTTQRDGSTNTAVSWNHQQEFSKDSHVQANLNFVTSTALQRQNTFNPYTALATIASALAYQTKFGPASVTVGGTRTQYPGRQQIDQTVPTVTLTSTPITLGDFFSWTPGFSYSQHDVLKIDQPGIGAFVFTTNPVTGLRDSSLSKDRSSRDETMTIGAPIQIFGWSLNNSVNIHYTRQNFPQLFSIYDVETGQVTATRIFANTYQSQVDWNPDFRLPSIWQNKLNITPSISLQNADPGPYWVASERTNGVYVSQTKRITAGLSAAPTLFGLFRGFGPFQRIRHSITPTIGWTYGPKADVSDEYLAALGRTRANSFVNLPLNNVNFGLTQLFQAKLRSRNDSNPDGGTKIDLLAISMTPLSYDFSRAQEADHRGLKNWRTSGFTTDTWGYSLRSDLLPGFDFSSQYSLFLGSTLSDTAEFKPYLTSISASFTLSRDQNPLQTFRKLFGAPPPTDSAKKAAALDDASRIRAENAAAQPVAGTVRGPERFLNQTSGWRARFDLTRSSPRPPKPGSTNVINFDPQAQCAQIAGSNPLLFDACVNAKRLQPTTEQPVTSLTAGGPAYIIPPTTNITSDIGFNLTPHWGAHWTTSYDLEHHAFASQNVQLQRDLHDWEALFGYTQSPNGNFAFTFTIRLKADPDIKVDYNRATVRSGVF
ncbi:MAG TPA: putative LPS assembly protein LptD [Gemmatimonadaceae bacterium]|jgi:hypothetical protein|nr:putative LPS assembly protein LptD [Gemmatimonadaceae bacterium]